MIIALEGPDLAGKSTLAADLARYYSERGKNFGIIKVSQPEGDSPISLFTEYVTKVYDAYTVTMEYPNTVRVFDRLHVGEWVYGPRKRANSQLSWNQIRALDDMLDGIKALKVFVDQSNSELLRRFDARGEEFVDKDELVDIAGHYRQLLDPFSREAHESHEASLHRWHRVTNANDLGGLL